MNQSLFFTEQFWIKGEYGFRVLLILFTLYEEVYIIK